MAVNGAGDRSYSRGKHRVVDTIVHRATYPLGSGSYWVAWRVVSADGHPVSGEFRFSVDLPPGQEPTGAPPAPARPPSPGQPGDS